MKVQSLHLEHFKQFREQKLDFIDAETGLAQDLVVLIGMNGSGKTSILQAIAATLGVATGRLQKLSELKWEGYNYELLSSNWGQFEPNVTLNVQFSKSEIEATQSFYEQLQNITPSLHTAPADRFLIPLHWNFNHERSVAPSEAEFFQFKGREYAKKLIRSQGFQIFEQVGTIFWYTEQRNSTSLTSEIDQNSLEITDNLLRDRLSKWRQFDQSIKEGKIKKLRSGQKNLYDEISKAYQRIFPKRQFEGPVPRDNIDDIMSEPWFYLYDGQNQYEISEMSAGERAIFPIIMDFANWNIHNSVILIDEIELHLHPPLQQTLLRALPKFGNNNQFIITTHSDYVEEMVSQDCVYYLG